MLNYFDYLRITKLKDTKDNFVLYLIKILNYTKEQANNEVKYYYKEVE